MSNKRIVYGARCIWWDDISQVGKTPLGQDGLSIPCCPCCGGVLFEVAELDWWKSVDDHDVKNAGYRKFIEWQRGKCFRTHEAARYAYELDTGVRL